jgi:hypothetical protein
MSDPEPPKLTKDEDKAARDLNREKTRKLRELASIDAEIVAFADTLNDAHDFIAQGFLYDSDTRAFVPRLKMPGRP